MTANTGAVEYSIFEVDRSASVEIENEEPLEWN